MISIYLDHLGASIGAEVFAPPEGPRMSKVYIQHDATCLADSSISRFAWLDLEDFDG